eukprot:gene19677-biopygen24734
MWDTRTPHTHIPSVPEVLRVVSLTQPHLRGCYHIVSNRQRNGMPVWQCGEKIMYADMHGLWKVARDEEQVAGDHGVFCSDEHGGLMPDAMAGWKTWDQRCQLHTCCDSDNGAWDGDGWRADDDVSVTRDRGSGTAASPGTAEVEAQQKAKAEVELQAKAPEPG